MKRLKNSLSRFIIGVSAPLCFCVLAAAVSACTNNLLSSAALKGSTTSSTTTTQIFSITNVIQDQSNPSGTLDVIGDGSGAMGTYCTASSGDPNAGVNGVGTSSGSSSSSGQSGTSNCGCMYTWTDPSTGTNGSVTVNTSYHESNMIECPYETAFFPSDVSQISVSVFLISSDTTPATNSMTLNLGNGAGSAISLTSALNYTAVTRYQCRDIQSIPYIHGLDGGTLGGGNSIYDPILSEDPELTYPLDFYTTDLGATISAYVQGSASLYDWNCPGNPDDPNFGSNYKLYSVGADSNGSYEIYPSTGSAFDRSTFYVSKTQAGVFTVPLDAYIAPTMISAKSNIGGPIGYGASPIVTGSGTEGCPNVSIPSGYQWVKVWLFRADLQDRHYAYSPAMTTVGAVACNPGLYVDGSQVFTDCGNSTCDSGTQTCTQVGTDAYCSGVNCSALNPGVTLADRILAGAGIPTSQEPMCVDLNLASAISGGTSGAGGTTQSSDSQYASYTAFGYGTDIWVPHALKENSGTAIDPLDLYGAKYGSANVPKDEALQSADLDAGQPRYDFVFVVTPTSVMAADMENSSNSSNYPYIPMRFPTASDCLSSNPNAPTGPGDCDPTKIIHYGLKLHDVSSNGDPPASDPNAAGVFPLCAIQPIN